MGHPKILTVNLALSLAIIASQTDLLAQDGNEITANQVVIETQSHWANWKYPEGTLSIIDGDIQPHRLSRNTNAMLDIVPFLRARPPDGIKKEPEEITVEDGIQGGSNKADVVNILDGNLETYWEPDAPAPDRELATQWWFTVDLGRVILANRIVARFVEEDLGDPFILFDVLVSDGIAPIRAPTSGIFDYTPVIQTLRPNRTQRVFEVDLSGVGADDRSQVVRYVQVIVQDSDLQRGEQLAGKEEHDQLPAEERGLVEYNKRLSDTRQTPVSESVFLQLDVEKRGDVSYFKRRHPRLAEIEVWGEGEELVQNAVVRGGAFITDVINTEVSKIFDGDANTHTGLSVSFPAEEGFAEVSVDLGTYYWINHYHMVLSYLTGGGTSVFGDYRLEFSEGDREPDGRLKWATALGVDGPGDGFPISRRGRLTTFRHQFEPLKARFFNLAYRGVNGTTFGGGKIHIAELQLFGVGYQPEVVLESDIIRLGGSRNLTTVEWDVEGPDDTSVALQTRTGNTLLPDSLYFKTDGTQVSAEVYYAKTTVRTKTQGEKKEVFNLGPDWSGWSAPYRDTEGSLITSPSPRQFMLLRASLLSDTPDTAATLNAIRVNFSEPVANQLLGAVIPGRIDALGVPLPFTLFVRPEENRGFNELLLTAPSGMTIARDVMYAGSEEELQDGVDMAHLALEATPVATGQDSLHLVFPLVSSDSEVVRLDFEGTVFSLGGQLRAFLRQADADGNGTWQRVDPEPDTPTSLHVVAFAERGELLSDLQIRPPVVTPNDDGINEEAVLDFAVFLANLDNAVEISIYDLSGRLVRTIREQRSSSAGRYTIPWNGRDDDSELVPPGLYTVLVRVDASTYGANVSRKSLLSTVAVSY